MHGITPVSLTYDDLLGMVTLARSYLLPRGLFLVSLSEHGVSDHQLSPSLYPKMSCSRLYPLWRSVHLECPAQEKSVLRVGLKKDIQVTIDAFLFF